VAHTDPDPHVSSTGVAVEVTSRAQPNTRRPKIDGRRHSVAQPVTIRSVADEAGVSIATVSRVMSGQTNVSRSRAALVREVAGRLGYTPNPVAQGLKSGSFRTVAVVVPNLSNPFFYDIIRGIGLKAQAARYQMVVLDSNEDPDKEVTICRDVLRYSDGLLLISPRMSAQDLQQLAAEDKPVVMVNRAEVGVGIPSLCVDNSAAMLEIYGHLSGLGHRKVVYLAGPSASWQNDMRQAAGIQAQAFGLEVKVVPAGGTIATGYKAVGRALELNPTAIVCFNDLSAFGALAGLKEHGIMVPDDISLTGFDDIEFSAYAAPSLTTARNPKRELGQLSWTIIEQLMRGEKLLPTPMLTAELIVRGSTAPVRR